MRLVLHDPVTACCKAYCIPENAENTDEKLKTGKCFCPLTAVYASIESVIKCSPVLYKPNRLG